MSKRRNIGDKVWIRKGAGFGQSQGEWGVIVEEPSYKAVPPDYTLPCPYNCGDSECQQWPAVKVGEDREFRFVTECEMFDHEQKRKTRRN